MKLRVIEPPRIFETGRGAPIAIADCARIELSPDEQVTFVTPAGAEYDVTRKAWGFYATPSLNGRLLNFNLRAAIARGPAAKYYVFLVERGHESAFEAYLAAEQNTLVRWLDNDDDLRAVETTTSVTSGPPLHCPCGGDRFTTVHTYFAPPEGEVRFASVPTNAYRREIYRCSLCGHFISVFAVAQALYTGEYVDSTYGDAEGMHRAFDRIMALPPERSDNASRVARIDAFAVVHLPAGARGILDVGSGLCVFLARMKAAGWLCTALDPDPRAASHAREVVGVSGIAGSLPNDSLGKFDAIAFNKVLEHVADPIALLAAARPHVAEHGFVYVELPDGEVAAREAGFGREEFFVEHVHVFSMASLARLAERAGFEVRELERLREPSGKYTLRAFLTPRQS
ncbi:MAG TPA: class I SAM-dependent methyltransferase [Kofleriaceae bacterium]|jgi:SAM-dependent methyltransferase|nr:class I SAM-dependent methyltransferase [Kofleriaceae bacterium]